MGGDSPKGIEEVKSLCLQRSYTDRKQDALSCPQVKRLRPHSEAPSTLEARVRCAAKNYEVFDNLYKEQLDLPNSHSQPKPRHPRQLAPSRSLTSAGDGRFIP